jgi:hypothetical protein
MRWRHVERYLRHAERAVPVLPDYLELSVGGTLSVGGYGFDSITHGAVVDHVVRIRLVRPGGTALWCSPREHPDLFSHALAGLGQVGAIERAEMLTVPRRRFTTLFTYRHDSFGALVDACGWLTDDSHPPPDAFKAFYSHGRIVSVYGVHAATWREARSARPPRAMGAGQHKRIICPEYRSVRSLAVGWWARRFASYRKLWCDYVLDHAGLKAFTGLLQSLLARDAFGGCLRDAYIVAIRRQPRDVPFPFEATERGRAPVVFGIGLYCMIPHREDHLVDHVDDVMAECLRACVALGGRPYLYGSHRLDGATRRVLYGTACDRLDELRQWRDQEEPTGAAAGCLDAVGS